MVVEKQVTGYVKTAIEVTDISILSADEYKTAEKNIPLVDGWWWLRSPGFYTYSSACVDPDGVAGDYGDLVNSICVGVRPVMRFNPESANIPTGDILRLDGILWTVIAPGLALCDEIICIMPFRKDVTADDANRYETSDVKAYLDERFAKYLAAETTSQMEMTAPLLPGSPKEYNETFYPMYSKTACALLCFEDTINKCDNPDDVRHQFRCSGWNQKNIDFLKEAIGFYNKAVKNAVVKAKAAQRKNGGTET